MNQYEVPALIADNIPEVRHELAEQAATGNVNNALHILTDYTFKMCKAHDLPGIQKCMKLADKIYVKGNNLVKNAVTNVFVYSFSMFRMSCNSIEWRLLQAKMPITLYSIYMQQVMKSGC
jgi:hypothetical protein